MSTGILRSWYLAKIRKSRNPMEYFLAMQEFMMYEMNVFNFNLRQYF